MNGILVINKEKGFTSHDVVAKLRGILHMKKIGHTGTLDPEAVGVLPVALGKGTRLVELLTEKEKTYEAVLRLGVVTDTQDMTGSVLEERPVAVTREEVEKALLGFLGDQMQIPPMYSALKVGGKKLYELAREGKVVERKPRPVHFYEIHLEDMELPRVRFTVTCSKGTYIRTLCHDLGEALGCGGCMEELLRTRVGRFSMEDAYTLQEVEEAVSENRVEELVYSIEEVLSEYPAVRCLPEGDRLLKNGNPLPEELLERGCREGWIRMYDSAGAFIGVFQWRDARGSYYPIKMF
ncbi:MAG: tRNA pseudouridine(55) synthase TruB [Eubacteriales bacterium]|nr:tRNA pseudouridine(55) synthase TruB [Eubacteriales bacterium]